jgi:hypothetical protein
LFPQGVVDGRSILDVEPEDLKGFTQCHLFAGIGGWALRIDNKWGPAQPGTQLVVDGVPERVAKLEGIGNAIVPQLGAIFINSFMEVMCNV